MARRRQRGIATSIAAQQRAYAWADQAIAYRIAGEVDRAKAAVAKARNGY